MKHSENKGDKQTEGWAKVIRDMHKREPVTNDKSIIDAKKFLCSCIDNWVENGTCAKKNGYQMAVRFRDAIEECFEKYFLIEKGKLK